MKSGFPVKSDADAGYLPRFSLWSRKGNGMRRGSRASFQTQAQRLNVLSMVDRVKIQ